MKKDTCPICGLNINNCGHENDSIVILTRKNAVLMESLLEFVRVENAFGHWAQHELSECADCSRVRKAMDALGYTEESVNLWMKNHMRIYGNTCGLDELRKQGEEKS